MKKRPYARRAKAVMAVLGLLSASCAEIKIEPTNLSSISADSDRKGIDTLLGSPIALEKSNGLLVAAYNYNRGYRAPRYSLPPHDRPRGGSENEMGKVILLVPPVLIIGGIGSALAYASEKEKAKASQLGKLVAVFNANQKLVYVGTLQNSDLDLPNKLRKISNCYASAQAGDGQALIDLSDLALNPLQKQALLERAADAGNPRANFELGNSKKDSVEKISYWEKSAALGYPPAQRELGSHYLLMPVGDRNAEKARDVLSKAADSGDQPAKELISHLNTFDEVMAKARTGNPDAQHRVSQYYSSGAIFLKDEAEEFRWLQLSAKTGHGNAKAQMALGESYFYGRGVEENLQRAIYWYRRAAENQSVDAQLKLATIYDFIPKSPDIWDPVEALKWYKIANFAEAKFHKTLLKKMSPNQIQESERRAREWLKAHPQTSDIKN